MFRRTMTRSRLYQLRRSVACGWILSKHSTRAEVLRFAKHWSLDREAALNGYYSGKSNRNA